MMKAKNSYKRKQGLTIEQLNAIDLLVTEKIDQEVADKIGVNRVTVTKWRNYDIYFRAELNKRRKEVWSSSLDRLRALLLKAMEQLEKEVERDHGWKIALELIKLIKIKSNDLTNIGHDNTDKILSAEAQQRSTEELFTYPCSCSNEQLLEEYENELRERE
ncbi:hypothetical protein [Priestia megaterium]|uniref:hypothetical protein n=1 Tax=Priestia megaterium TaxID=1404 RepID=UPI00345ADFA3